MLFRELTIWWERNKYTGDSFALRDTARCGWGGGSGIHDDYLKTAHQLGILRDENQVKRKGRQRHGGGCGGQCATPSTRVIRTESLNPKSLV